MSVEACYYYYYYHTGTGYTHQTAARLGTLTYPENVILCVSVQTKFRGTYMYYYHI